MYGYWYFSEPKYRSYRLIDLDNETCALLKREYEKQKRAEEYYSIGDHYTRYYVEEKLVFGGVVPDVYASPSNVISNSVTNFELHFVCRRADGTYISPRTLQHTTSIIQHKLGISEFDYHSLRHTHTTMLIENGAPPIYAKNRLGHKNMETTMNIYANHMTKAFKEQGCEVLNKMY